MLLFYTSSYTYASWLLSLKRGTLDVWKMIGRGLYIRNSIIIVVYIVEDSVNIEQSRGNRTFWRSYQLCRWSFSVSQAKYNAGLSDYLHTALKSNKVFWYFKSGKISSLRIKIINRINIINCAYRWINKLKILLAEEHPIRLLFLQTMDLSSFTLQFWAEFRISKVEIDLW